MSIVLQKLSGGLGSQTMCSFIYYLFHWGIGWNISFRARLILLGIGKREKVFFLFEDYGWCLLSGYIGFNCVA